MQQLSFQKHSVTTSITIVMLAVFLFIVWNIFSVAPLFFFSSPWSLFWFLFACVAGFFSYGSPSMFPFVLSLAPQHGGRRRRASLRVLVGVIAAGVSSALLLYLFLQAHVVFAFISVFISPLGLMTLVAIFSYIIGLSWFGVLPVVPARFFAYRFSPTFSANLLGVFVYNVVSYVLDIVPYLFIVIFPFLLGRNYLLVAYMLFGFLLGRIAVPLFVSLHTSFNIDSTRLLVRERQLGKKILAGVYLFFGPLCLYASLYATPFVFYRVYASLDILIPVLWMLPLWISYWNESRIVFSHPLHELRTLLLSIEEAKEEERQLKLTSHFSSLSSQKRVDDIAKYLEQAYMEATLLDSAVRNGISTPFRSPTSQAKKEQALFRKLAMTVLSSFGILLAYHLYL